MPSPAMMQTIRSWICMLPVLTFVACSSGGSVAASVPSPDVHLSEGKIPFTFQGETFQTYFKAFGNFLDSVHPPLVVLHGGPGLTHDYLIPISDLAHTANIPVIFYDQLGNGRSTHLDSKPVDFWSIELFMEELNNLVHHFSIQHSFSILGHSWGGELAAEFEVQKKPPGLKKLIITDAPASSELWGESLAQLVQPFPPDIQEGLAIGMADPQRYWAAFQVFSAVHGCTVKPPPGPLNASFLAIFGPDGDTTVASAPFTDDWTIVDRVSQISVPTLLLNGREDMAQNFTMQPFADGIPDVRQHQFMQSSHTPFWEERASYMQVVGDFWCFKLSGMGNVPFTKIHMATVP